MSLSGVSAISFDLDDTLWSFKTVVERAEGTLHSWLLEQAPRVATVLSTRQALGRLRDDYERSQPGLPGDFRALRIGSIRLALEMAGEDVSLTDDAYRIFVAARHEVQFYDDVMPALQWLSARFPLIAVTNGNADLRMTGGSEFFRLTLSAGSLGIAKPAAGIFHAAACAAGIAPAEMLHVGDDYDLDVVGALGAGLQAAWLRREEHSVAVPSQPIAQGRHLVINDLSMLCLAVGGPDKF
ncbi:HAD family hydrolase [Paraburkholderia sp. CNPSo 3281]|uniref:HAD family hydrolase n=1 Tax=Paraburkholderia sp. CNPSo 3281 TaxID=2940933 RepID=UPI0020B6F875|nr:HAD-IA family hydrolase [Paraburkholderia sp. CNPSo 3281]MCP3720990.1 HAD-IA family hydrolase [Paraburkholderia sp. CNPSo 3281]